MAADRRRPGLPGERRRARSGSRGSSPTGSPPSLRGINRQPIHFEGTCAPTTDGRTTWTPTHDRASSLASYRTQFPIEHTTYLVSHSLGAMPRAVTTTSARSARLGDARRPRVARGLVGHGTRDRRPARPDSRRGARELFRCTRTSRWPWASSCRPDFGTPNRIVVVTSSPR